MIRESPMRISACMIFPSGPTAREISSAPSAFLYHSSASTARSSVSCGVTVWWPSGTACLAFDMSNLLHQTSLAFSCDADATRKLIKFTASLSHNFGCV